jgi:sugar O-acyltransferase (sialic acid O-acetyltransferase NeuD family)
MTVPLFIIGAGGFGREVYSIIEALENAGGEPYSVCFIDDTPSPIDLERVAALGSQIVGSTNYLTRRTERFSAVLAIGSPTTRRAIAQLLSRSPVTYPVLVHPDTTIGRGVELAEGVVVAAGSRLSTNIRVGSHVHIDQNAVVGHDCILNDYSRLNPQACVSGGVTIGRGALVGANATVLQGLIVGDDAIVGASSCVVKDVPDETVVKGVPAR